MLITKNPRFFFQTLNKKEHRSSESPDLADTSLYVLASPTDEKYQKINEEFDIMMRNHKLVSC